MATDILVESEKLFLNRLMKTNEEIIQFEESLAAIYNLKNSKHIQYLCRGFDDATEQFEITYGLIHAIEAYYKTDEEKKVTQQLLESFPKMLPQAAQWIKFLLIRQLNDPHYRTLLCDALREASPKAYEITLNSLDKIAKDDSTHFEPLVTELIENLLK